MGDSSEETHRQMEDEFEMTLDNSTGYSNFILHSWGGRDGRSTAHGREACGWRRILWVSLAYWVPKVTAGAGSCWSHTLYESWEDLASF